MKIDIFSSAAASFFSSILKDAQYLFIKNTRRKTGYVPSAQAHTSFRSSPLKSEITNITMLASSETDIDIGELVTYYREAAVSSVVFIVPGSHDIYRSAPVENVVMLQGEDSLASVDRSCYTFERITGYPSAAEFASPNSTKERGIDEELERRINTLFMMSGDEGFESGMISDFSKELCSIINSHDKNAMEIISYLFLYRKINPVVMSEALRWLGKIEQEESHSYRLWLLEKNLESSLIYVRDGAISGIAALDDPSAIPAVRRAIEKETCRELCDDMKSVLEQLEETSKWE